MLLNDLLVIASLLVLFSTVAWLLVSFFRYQRSKSISLIAVAIGGIFLAALLSFIPAYMMEHDWWEAIPYSVQHAIRLFLADDGHAIFEFCACKGIFTFIPLWLYRSHMHFIFILAPIITFSAVLALLKKIWYAFRYSFTFYTETHAFSELNDKTLALARSIQENYVHSRIEAKEKRKERRRDFRASGFKKKLFFTLEFVRSLLKLGRKGHSAAEEQKKIRKPLIVFSDIIDKNEEAHFDLVDGAKELGAILFRRDIASVKWSYFGKRSISFYLISDDEGEKLRHTNHIKNNYNYSNCKLYLFSDSVESELYMKNCAKKADSLKIKGIRINENKFLIYNYLYQNGVELFEGAEQNGELKTVYVTVLGFGKHGSEFVKALLWYCQLPGYKVDITVIDSDPQAKSRFVAECPEIIPDEDNLSSAGDMRYRISFKSATFGTNEFNALISDNIAPLRTVFVCLGDDNLNLRACQSVKINYGRKASRNNKNITDSKIRVVSIIRNVETKELAEDLGVVAIGDYNSYYNINVFSSVSPLIRAGFEEHKLYGSESESVKYTTYNFNDYNFYSSTSKAIHRMIRISQKCPVLDKKYDEILARTKTAKDCCTYKNEEKFKSLKDNTLTIEEYGKKAKTDGEKKLWRELCAIAEFEHVRWNAYMRASGYIWGAKTSHEYKMHSNLVPVKDLPVNKVKEDI